jgi:hypothetical protein
MLPGVFPRRVATMGDVMDIGDVSTPEFGEIFIVRNGERLPMKAYKSGNLCPGSAKGLVSAARKEYRESTGLGTMVPKIDPETGEPQRAEDGTDIMVSGFVEDDIAWFRMLRNLLTAVVPGLSDKEADILSGDDEKTLDILRGLGWWPKAEEVVEPGESKGEPVPITDTSSPD